MDTDKKCENENNCLLCKNIDLTKSNSNQTMTIDQALEEIARLNREIFLLKRKLEEKNEGNLWTLFC